MVAEVLNKKQKFPNLLIARTKFDEINACVHCT